ncbi:aminopeptidase N [Candidatus Venteria ishoeyi]|uniref:Aminopeptidase N n=4 Tax=Candidatus Venteria ishoeyi TaxID=1899563 RepID=A0A1H6F947_9GAMM|nr:aminopeptidase N [Candidatus Venteria ishoeyi]SEH06637.1 Aminopeptidase N [Candidatus Venteria ishoeyi]
MKDQEKTPHSIYRKDYQAPYYWIDAVDLTFELGEDATRVRARLQMRRNLENNRSGGHNLVLHGEQLKTLSLKVNDNALAADIWQADEENLTVLTQLPEQFVLESEVEIYPQNNTSLDGLYQSSGNFCTQCEAEGFRRITWFLDRPDVMARYSSTIIADQKKYPVLLSNGNRCEQRDLGDGRHLVRWEDPFLKPSYLFALVAGNLACLDGEFITRSGRKVRLEIWVEPQNIEQCEHALRSLQQSMKWDEERFGLEYDLDIYMIVAVSDFNMGAMENKGLNVFNTKYVLSSPETATDKDYEDIQGVIGHEYFHNWTGNRVTCRDWFQLTLKEGLTVFRDEQFSADMGSAAVKRIEDVKILRTAQFDEDRGPMAHPIRPDSYIEMNNFYTVTVYNKGAEIIRLYHTLLGEAGFRKGMDLYFQRFDGQAVTCDDFRMAMADANDEDFTQLERWYDQAGTPLLHIDMEYDAEAKSCTLHLQQSQSTPDLVKNWQPWVIPVRIGLLGEQGEDLLCRLDDTPDAKTEHVLKVTQEKQSFRFHEVNARPVLSPLRRFSAPVKLDMQRDREEMAFLMAHDSDHFNRWDAGQTLAQDVLLDLTADIQARRELSLDSLFVSGFEKILHDTHLDGAIKALMLTLPNEHLLSLQMQEIDMDALHTAREFALSTLAQHFKQQWLDLYHSLRSTTPYSNDKNAINRRRLQACALEFLGYLPHTDHQHIGIQLAEEQFQAADNMSDAEAALKLLVNHPGPARDKALSDFYKRWKHEPLVLDKWFTLQASANHPGVVDEVLALAQHPDFSMKNPNRFRSLINIFSAKNPTYFHAKDGRGYQFLAEQVLAMDALNPQTAARVVSAFNQWKHYDVARRALMQAQLKRIIASPGLSKDVYEIVSRSLG